MPVSRNFSLPSSIESRKYKKRPDELHYAARPCSANDHHNNDDVSSDSKPPGSDYSSTFQPSSTTTPSPLRSASPKVSLSSKTRAPVTRIALSHPCLSETKTVSATSIFPHLFLGSQRDVTDQILMKENHISNVLNVSSNCSRPEELDDDHFRRIAIDDNYRERITPHLDEAIDFIEKIRKKKEKVLVHCLAGVSRSATVAIAYVMYYLRLNFDDAYRFVKDKRPTISPNFNFLGQLMEYEKKLIDNDHFSKPRTGSIPDDDLVDRSSLGSGQDLKQMRDLSTPLFRCNASKPTEGEETSPLTKFSLASGCEKRSFLLSTSLSRRRRGPTLDKSSFAKPTETAAKPSIRTYPAHTPASPGGAGVVLDLQVVVPVESHLHRLGSDGVEDDDAVDDEPLPVNHKSNSLPRNMSRFLERMQGKSSCPTPPAAHLVSDTFPFNLRPSTAPNTPGQYHNPHNTSLYPPTCNLSAYDRLFPGDVEMSQVSDDSKNRSRSRTCPTSLQLASSCLPFNDSFVTTKSSMNGDKGNPRKAWSPKISKKSMAGGGLRQPYHQAHRSVRQLNSSYSPMPQRNRSKDLLNLKLGPIRSLHCESPSAEGISSLTLYSPTVVKNDPLEVVGKKCFHSHKVGSLLHPSGHSSNKRDSHMASIKADSSTFNSKSGEAFQLASSGELKLKWRKRSPRNPVPTEKPVTPCGSTPPSPSVLGHSCGSNVSIISCS